MKSAKLKKSRLQRISERELGAFTCIARFVIFFFLIFTFTCIKGFSFSSFLLLLSNFNFQMHCEVLLIFFLNFVSYYFFLLWTRRFHVHWKVCQFLLSNFHFLNFTLTCIAMFFNFHFHMHCEVCPFFILILLIFSIELGTFICIARFALLFFLT